MLVAIVLAGCSPTPSPQPSSLPTVAPTTPPASPAALALEACDPDGWLACVIDDTLISVPLAGTSAMLTWNSRWALGASAWSARGLGLGDWSIDLVKRYIVTDGVLVNGDGDWRQTATVAVPGGVAIPRRNSDLVDVFDSSGRHVRVVDAVLGVTTLAMSYDDEGRLLSVRGNAAGRPVDLEVERASDGSPVAIVAGAGAGARTELRLDGSGRLVLVRDPSGAGTDIGLDATGRVIEVKDSLGASSRYTYDDVGHLLATEDPDGVVVTYARVMQPTSVEITRSTELGVVTRATTTQAADGVIDRRIEDAGVIAELDARPDGTRTLRLPGGSSIEIERRPDPRWAAVLPIQSPLIVKSNDGSERRLETSVSVTVASDPLTPSAWSTTILDAGATTTFKLDVAARSITTTDAAGLTSVDAFDDSGRLVRRSAPGLPNLARTYDGDGRLASETVGTGSTGQTTSYSYDANSGVMTRTNPDGTTEAISVDSVGRPIRSIDGAGATIVSSYDVVGRLTTIHAGDHVGTFLGSSPAGRPTAFMAAGADPEPAVVGYDADGRASGVAGPGDHSVSIGYDKAGRMSSWTDAVVTVTGTTDPVTGLLTAATRSGGASTTYQWVRDRLVETSWSGPISGAVTWTLDAHGWVTSETASAFAIDRAYDAAGRLLAVGETTLQRDPVSGLVTKVTTGAVVTTYEWDADARLTRIVTRAGDETLLDRRLGRDELGRLKSIEESVNGAASSTAYTLDDAGRLIGVAEDGTSVTYELDQAGNRRTATTGKTTITSTYDTADRIVSSGAATYSTDDRGNVVARRDASGASSFAYDGRGALVSASTADGRTIAYVLDGLGQRVGRTVDGAGLVGYLVDPEGRIVATTDAAGAITGRFSYDDSGLLIAMQRGAASYAIVTDQVGSPLLVIDAQTGAISEALRYDAWGRTLSDSAPGFQPFGFAGGLRDPDTGLVHFGAREYDPATARWTTPDPIGFDAGDVNLYRYAGGDPVNARDANGLTTTCIWHCEVDDGNKHIECYRAICHFEKNNLECLSVYGWGECNLRDNRNGSWDTGEGCVGAFWCHINDDDFTCIGVACTPYTGRCEVYCSMGDPHLVSADGQRFDFQAAGEFDLVISGDGSLQIQGRMEALGPNISVNTAVAALVGGHRVGVYAGNDALGAVVRIDGKELKGNPRSAAIAGGGSVERLGADVSVVWPDGSRLSVIVGSGRLDLAFTPDPRLGPDLTGLLGSADGNAENDFNTRNGAPTTSPDRYSIFGKSWRVTQASSLFDYANGETTATFTDLTMPHDRATVDDLDPATRAAAEATCRAFGVASGQSLQDCILDVGLTGDPSYASSAASTAASEANLAPPGAQVATGPANITAPAEVEAGKTFDVAWTGPRGRGDYITIVLAGAAKWTNEPYFLTTRDSPSALTAPSVEGAYALWYVSGVDESILARVEIRVTPFQGGLTAPDSVMAGSQFDVAWTGPNGPRDYVTIVKSSATEWTGESYFYTTYGSPGKLTAGIEPGSYELWYVIGSDDSIKSRRPITVTPYAVTMQAPATVAKGAQFQVNWTGPNGPQDYITIVPVGSQPGAYLSYAYTSSGNPATITAPTESGNYEIWYASDRIKFLVFGKIEIKVN